MKNPPLLPEQPTADITHSLGDQSRRSGDPALDRTARMSARLLRAPVAFIALSEHAGQYFAGAHGLPEPFATTRTASYTLDVFATIIKSGQPLRITGIEEVAPQRAFGTAYLGLPLHDTHGNPVGALVVADPTRRIWSDDDLAALEDLRDQAEHELRWRTRAQIWHATDNALRLYSASVQQTTESVMITNAMLDMPGPQIIYVNPAFAAMTGYAAEELIGKTPRLLQGELTDRATLARMGETLARGEPFAGEAINYRKDGSSYTVEWKIAPIHDSNGRLIYWVSTQRDVTERRTAEDALRESEERYRTITETAMDAILTVDQDSRIVFANRAAEQVFGYTAAELIEQPLSILMPNHMWHHHHTGFTRYLVTGERKLSSWAAMQLPGRHRDGRIIPLEISIGEVVRAGKRLFIAVIRDISARKRMEQELQQSYNLLNAVIEGATDAIYVKDLNGRYLTVNSATAAIFNQEASQFISHHDRDFFPEDVVAQIDQRDNQVMATGTPQAIEENFTISGKTRVFHTIRTPYRDASGQIIGLIGIARDITERKQLEAQFLQAQKMESIGRLAGGIAHDFNNLLTAILGYTAFLLETADPRSDMFGDLKEIQRAAERATSLTRQLLAFARRQVIEPRPVNLNTLLLDMNKLIYRLIGEDIELVALPSLQQEVVQGDAGQIEQVIVNLAVNARDAMPNGGQLLIKLDRFELSASDAAQFALAPGQYAEIQVSDTGVGMDAATRSQLFEPFFTTKEPGRGTGLGLATCYGIIKQHGGHIWIDSSPGLGTTIHVVLPVVDHAGNTGQIANEAALLPNGSETLLLVEDEPAVRALALRILQRQGYHVLVANNGVEAIRLLDTMHYPNLDLLVTDLVMPQMGGIALVEELSRRYPQLRTLFMSGYLDTGLISAPSNASGGFLQKPFTLHALTHAVRSLLDRQNR